MTDPIVGKIIDPQEPRTFHGAPIFDFVYIPTDAAPVLLEDGERIHQITTLDQEQRP